MPKELGQEIYEEVKNSHDSGKLIKKLGKWAIVLTALTLMPLSVTSCFPEKKTHQQETQIVQQAEEQIPIEKAWLKYYSNCQKEIDDLKVLWDRTPKREIKEFPVKLQDEAAKIVQVISQNTADNAVLGLEEYFYTTLKAVNFSIDLVNYYNEVFDTQLLESEYCQYLVVPYYHKELNLLEISSSTSHPILDIYNNMIDNLSDIRTVLMSKPDTYTLLDKLGLLKKKVNAAITLSSLEIGYASKKQEAKLNIPKRMANQFNTLNKNFKDLFKSVYPENNTFSLISSFKALNSKLKALERVIEDHISYLKGEEQSDLGKIKILEGTLPLYKEWLTYNREDFLKYVGNSWTHKEGATIELQTSSGSKIVQLPKNATYSIGVIGPLVKAIFNSPTDLGLYALYMGWKEPNDYYFFRRNCSAIITVEDPNNPGNTISVDKIPGKDCTGEALWDFTDNGRDKYFDSVHYEIISNTIP